MNEQFRHSFEQLAGYQGGAAFEGGTEGRTQMTRADAAVFGTALALRSQDADLVEFGSGSTV